MNRGFIQLLLEQNHLFFLLPCEERCFVFSKQNSLYRSIYMNIITKKDKSTSYVMLDYLRKIEFLFPLHSIELFFCYDSYNHRAYCFEAGILDLTRTSVSMNKYSDYILSSFTQGCSREQYLASSEQDDMDLLKRLS